MQNHKMIALAVGLCSSIVLPVHISADYADNMTCMQIDLVNGGHTFLKVDNDLRLDVADGSVSVITYNPPITVTDLMKVPAEGYWKLNYDLQDVVGFKYVNLSLTGVDGVVADAPVLDFNGNVLSVETGKAGRCVIYSLDGTVEDSISFEGTTQIDMSRYGKGVHLIKIDENEPLKINIR